MNVEAERKSIIWYCGGVCPWCFRSWWIVNTRGTLCML